MHLAPQVHLHRQPRRAAQVPSFLRPFRVSSSSIFPLSYHSSNPRNRYAPAGSSIQRYDDIAAWPRARGNCRELIGLYHVKRFSSAKLLHGCLVSVRVNSPGGLNDRHRIIDVNANAFVPRRTRFSSVLRSVRQQEGHHDQPQATSGFSSSPFRRYDIGNIALIFPSVCLPCSTCRWTMSTSMPLVLWSRGCRCSSKGDKI